MEMAYAIFVLGVAQGLAGIVQQKNQPQQPVLLRGTLNRFRDVLSDVVDVPGIPLLKPKTWLDFRDDCRQDALVANEHAADILSLQQGN